MRVLNNKAIKTAPIVCQFILSRTQSITNHPSYINNNAAHTRTYPPT